MDNVENKVIKWDKDQDIIESIYGKVKRPTEEDLYNELNYYRATKLTDKMLEAGLINVDEHKAIMRENRRTFPTLLNQLEPDD